MEQLDALCFTRDKEPHDRDVHQRHLIQVEHERPAVSADLDLELVQVLRPQGPMSRSAVVWPSHAVSILRVT